MADKPIVEDLQKLEITDAIVHLFELEVTKGNFFYFTNQIENDYGQRFQIWAPKRHVWIQKVSFEATVKYM